MPGLRLYFPLPMRVFFALLVALSAAAGASAQTPPAAPTPPPPAAAAATAAGSAPASNAPLDLPATICGLTVPPPSKLPPANSPPIVYQLMPCFEKQGGYSVIEVQTYLYYIQMATHVSLP